MPVYTWNRLTIPVSGAISIVRAVVHGASVHGEHSLPRWAWRRSRLMPEALSGRAAGCFVSASFTVLNTPVVVEIPPPVCPGAVRLPQTNRRVVLLHGWITFGL